MDRAAAFGCGNYAEYIFNIIIFKSVSMIRLQPNETILMVLHRHWIAIALKLLVVLIFLLLPFVAIAILPQAGFDIETVLPLIQFFLITYLMILVLGVFIMWTDYYFDVWVVTDLRIIDIEQRTIFNREVSEFMLYNIQDVTVEIPSVLATFLKYGNIKIQTAGGKIFEISDIPNVTEAKNVIIDHVPKSAVG